MKIGSDAQARVSGGQVALRQPDLQPIVPWRNIAKLKVAACVTEDSSTLVRIRALSRSYIEDDLHLFDALSLVRIPVVVSVDPGISIDG